MKNKTILIGIIFLLIILSCQSQYTPKIYMVGEDSTRSMKAEQSYFLNGYELDKDNFSRPVIKGDNTVIATYQSLADPRQELETGLIKALAEIEYRIFAELPPLTQTDSFDLAGRSICLQIGNYDLPESLRVYTCRQGYIAIDTLKSNIIFSRVKGIYLNDLNDTLTFSGNIRARSFAPSGGNVVYPFE